MLAANRHKLAVSTFALTFIIFTGDRQAARADAPKKEETAKPASDVANQISTLLAKHPQTFELTLMSHFTDNDFGFQIQTVRPSPLEDSFVPKHLISARQAGAIINGLAKTSFGKQAKEGKRNEIFQLGVPRSKKRVFSLTIRCGERAFFEAIYGDTKMQEHAAVIAATLRGKSPIGREFYQSFQSKLAK